MHHKFKISAFSLVFLSSLGFCSMASASASVVRPAPLRIAEQDSHHSSSMNGRVNWEGAYIGADFGYSIDTGSSSDVDSNSFSHNEARNSGPIVGVFAGANFNLPYRFVFGIEGSVSQAFTRGVDQELEMTSLPSSDGEGTSTSSKHSVEMRSHWMGAVRGRLGYSLGRFLPYFALGASFHNYERTLVTNDQKNQYMAANSGSVGGLTLGAGTDFAFTDSVLLRIEYRYAAYSPMSYRKSANESVDYNHRPHDIRLGIGYRF